MFDDHAYRRANNAIHAPDALKAKVKAAHPPARRRLPKIGGLVAAVLAVAFLLHLPLWDTSTGQLDPGQFASAAYVAQYPEPLSFEQIFADSEDPGFDWDAAYETWESYRDSIRVDADYLSSLAPFTRDSLRAVFQGLDPGDNRVYSPLALYMALSITAELSDGATRQQILDALGSPDLPTLREQTNRIWNTVRQDGRASQTLLANSLWLSGREEYQFKEAPLLTLRDSYYASTYVADMGSSSTLDAIHSWLDQQTGGLLSDQAEAVEVDAGTVALLLSTVYFHDQWVQQFSEEKTAPDSFHLTDGSEVSCDFMHKTYTGSYVGAEGFTAASLSFEGNGSMTFVLPDEGVGVDALLADDALLERILEGGGQDPDSAFGEIRLSVPKFSVASTLDLIPVLEEMGITDLFDWTAADFTPLSDYPQLYIDRATQATTVSIDEVGCTAASFVEMEMRVGSAMPDGVCVLDLDRPFLFVISGVEQVPLFIGVVNNPTL